MSNQKCQISKFGNIYIMKNENVDIKFSAHGTFLE